MYSAGVQCTAGTAAALHSCTTTLFAAAAPARTDIQPTPRYVHCAKVGLIKAIRVIVHALECLLCSSTVSLVRDSRAVATYDPVNPQLLMPTTASRASRSDLQLSTYFICYLLDSQDWLLVHYVECTTSPVSIACRSCCCCTEPASVQALLVPTGYRQGLVLTEQQIRRR